MSGKSRSYKIGLYERLQDDEHALGYLQACLEDSRQIFFCGLRNVAEAWRPTRLASVNELERDAVFQMLAEGENPTLETLERVLRTLGMRLSIEKALPSTDESSSAAA